MRVFHHKLQSGFALEGYCSKHFTGLDTLRYATQLLLPRVDVRVTVRKSETDIERERETERELVIFIKHDPTNTKQTVKNKYGTIP
jgi:hypothetical protein